MRIGKLLPLTFVALPLLLRWYSGTRGCESNVSSLNRQRRRRCHEQSIPDQPPALQRVADGH
jgi:hypothetical protein